MTVKIEVLKNILPALEQGLDRAAGDWLEAGAHDTRDYVAEHAPRDTGRLADGYYVIRTGPTSCELRSGDDVDYAAYVELGTYRAHAQPHFYPGVMMAGELLARQMRLFTAWLESLS
jgi:hypothetical protein